ncbi:MAG: class I SAM-dependent methyltransferase [Nitrospirae bacterium]|nr:MAG: class I SAM-dependent methyltransferase [Nitrospirota bacterium]
MIPNHDLPLGHLTYCQICGSQNLELVLDLGHHPPCDSLLKKEQLHEAERSYPLRFMRCVECGLVQIDYVVAPEVLFFPDYPYRSGITETLSRYLQGLAFKIVDEYALDRTALAIDIGSNDGTVLQGFKAKGLRVLGIEPTNVAKIAIANGIPTVQEFFTESLAKQVRAEYGAVSVVTATNMFAHVNVLGSLICGVSTLLDDGGLFVTESHYLLDLVETVQYDSIYHEHLKYYSLKPMIRLMSYYDFTIVDVERIPNYGGSIRVYAKKGKWDKVSDRVTALVQLEEEKGLYDRCTYKRFADQVICSKVDLLSLTADLHKQGKRVVGIGCPGRASTSLNYCNLDTVLMPYIAEQASSLKLGLYSPGNHIPIVDERIMFEENPEYAVMLSWHYAAPIIKKLREKGLRSKIIIPLPQVHVSED